MCIIERPLITIDGRHIDCELVRPKGNCTDNGTIVLLHQGLGDMNQWGDLPTRLCEKLLVPVFSYSRFGHGNSDDFDSTENLRYLDDEATTYLPLVLEKAKIKHPFLVGHSDGATIALVYGSHFHSELTGAFIASPHVFVEEVTRQGVKKTAAAYKKKCGLYRALQKIHRNADRLVERWSNIWSSELFRNWTIEERLDCWQKPLMVVQGDKDEYGSLEQLNSITKKVKVTTKILKECGHLPFTERAEQIFDLLVQFYCAVVQLKT